MCGIAGNLDAGGPVDRELVERMCGTMRHRGPDSAGLFAEDGIALGARRLAVIDLESGDQPIFNEDHSLVLVSNGEIYNYLELRKDLLRAGHRFATRSDTEVIVHLYEQYGERCLEQLRGMFAFALWDRRARRLLIARDRVGKKPLFYCQRGRSFWFASEPRAILADKRIPRDVDYEAIDSYLHYNYVPHPRSAFAALRKLPPAHVLTWQEGTVATRRYWKLSYRDRFEDISESDVCEMIREGLLESTRLRLRSDVPTGAMLSGGVDSSSVVAAMARLRPERVKTFSIGFDVEAYDESASARQVADMYGTDHHELVLTPKAIALLPRLVWHYGEPFGDSSALATFALAEMARRDVTVALNGDGGDESFAGYTRYLPYAPTWDGSSPFPLNETVHRYAARMSRFNDTERDNLYEPDFLDSLGERPWLSTVARPFRTSDADNVLERLLDVDVQSYLPDDLMVKMDVATMAHSLEARSPLLDHRFMEMAAGLPARLKIEGARSKRIFKQAIREWLPANTLDKPKQGFTVPVGDWLRNGLHRLAEEILLDPRSLERGLFKEEGLRSIIREHVEGAFDHERKIWILLQLELWFRTYIDGPPRELPVEIPVAEREAV
jgi:asparagine synthase (glutamine-hydrolysing)